MFYARLTADPQSDAVPRTEDRNDDQLNNDRSAAYAHDQRHGEVRPEAVLAPRGPPRNYHVLDPKQFVLHATNRKQFVCDECLRPEAVLCHVTDPKRYLHHVTDRTSCLAMKHHMTDRKQLFTT